MEETMDPFVLLSQGKGQARPWEVAFGKEQENANRVFLIVVIVT